MKKIISVLCALALVSAVAFAQKPENKGNKEQWRERARAEQVALITEELNLTEAEAQAFWPVYNEVQAQRREAFNASVEAMKALKKGVDSDEAAKLLLAEEKFRHRQIGKLGKRDDDSRRGPGRKGLQPVKEEIVAE